MNDATHPNRTRPASRGDDAGHEREPGGERGKPPVVAGHQVGDRGGRQRGGGRHGPDHEVPRRPEHGVEHQRGDGGVEADHRRDAGELVAENAAFRLRQAGEATDEPGASGSETAVGPVDRGDVDPHEQSVDLRYRPGDIHDVHDLWEAVTDRDRCLHRR
jgi:hypothetical protein